MRSICCCFFFVVFGLISWGEANQKRGALTAVAFLLGSFTSVACGYIGMIVAVYSNVRTTINCQLPGYVEGFNTAFRAGGVMGFVLTGLGTLVL